MSLVPDTAFCGTVRVVTTAGLISVALNVFSVGFTTWVLRRVHPLVKEIVSTRTKLADKGHELILANDKLIETNRKLIEVQMQLKDALNDASVQKGMRVIEHDAFLEKLRAAEMRVAWAERRAAALPSVATIYVPGLDDKTKSLVRLAVGNSEKNEAAAAALLVCKRLKERMGE